MDLSDVEIKETNECFDEEEEVDSKDTRLTIREEILLLCLKDREELALRKRFALDPAGMRKKSFLSPEDLRKLKKKQTISTLN